MNSAETYQMSLCVCVCVHEYECAQKASSIYCMQHAYQQAITIDLLMLENAAALIELRSRKSVNVADSDTGI